MLPFASAVIDGFVSVAPDPTPFCVTCHPVLFKEESNLRTTALPLSYSNTYTLPDCPSAISRAYGDVLVDETSGYSLLNKGFPAESYLIIRKLKFVPSKDEFPITITLPEPSITTAYAASLPNPLA